MARKSTTKPATDMTATADEAAITLAASNADEHNKNLSEIDSRFGNGHSYELQQVSNELRFYLNHSAEAMLEAGKRLILIKEHEKHGEFTKILQSIGIAARPARQMMQAAIKFTGNRDALVGLGKTKMLELMVEDDEDLDMMLDGGTIANLTLDDMERLSSSELRQELRKARQTIQDSEEVQERLLEQKDKKINQLDKKLHDVRKRSKQWDYAVKEFQIETTTLAGGALEKLDQLDVLRDVFLTADFGDDNEAANEAMAVTYYDAISQLTDKISLLMHDCNEVFGGYKDIIKIK